MRRFIFGVLVPLVACRAVDPNIGGDGNGNGQVDTGGLGDDTGAGPDDTGAELVDADEDGFDSTEDCDDINPNINPGMDERCNGLDDDCDGQTDVDAVDGQVWYVDDDGDGFGDAGSAESSCETLSDRVEDGSDCDDLDAEVYPGQVELCDGFDNDCDAASREDGTVTFFDARGNAFDETPRFASGTFSSPLEYTLSQEGTLMLCGGEWYASLEIDAPTEIIGVGGATLNTLNGARDVRLVEVEDDVTIQGVTLTLGNAGSSTQSQGGALLCDSGSTVILDDVVVSDSEAGQGGGLYLSGCTVEISDSQINDNYASYYGGAMSITGGDVTISGTTITDNEAPNYGGAMYITTTSNSTSSVVNLELADTLISDNTSGYYGSALYIYPGYRSGGVNVACERSGAAPQGGFLGNESSSSFSQGGAIYLASYGSVLTFSSVGCDFGADGSSDDNDPSDIYYQGMSQGQKYDYDNAESFTCSSASGGCK